MTLMMRDLENRELGREEGREEGLSQGLRQGLRQGREEGIFDTLFSLVKGRLLSVSNAAATAGVSEEVFLQRMRGSRMDA